ncbi:flagellar basal body rod protein FlgB [bacterium]|nr:flagellar basal body rod protein FlgB [bacterium]
MDLLVRDVTFAALAQSLSALSLRQELIAGNIANVNTPGYKRRDVDFTTQLAAALARPGKRAGRAALVRGVTARELVEQQLFYRPDMGGVDLDREMAEQAKTSMMYATIAQLIHNKIRQYRAVIKEGLV